MSCQQHQERRAVSVCTTCTNVLICQECVSRVHSRHVVRKPSEVAASIKRELNERKSHDVELIANLESDLQHIPNLKKEQKKANTVAEKGINLQRERLHEAVDSIADKLLASNHANVKQNGIILDNCANKFQQHIIFTSKHKSAITLILKEPDDVSVINKAASLTAMKKLTLNGPETVTYIPGIIDFPQLEEMFICSTALSQEEPPRVTPEEAEIPQHCVTSRVTQTNIGASHSVDNSSDCVDNVYLKKREVDESVEAEENVQAQQISSFQCSKDLFLKTYAFEIWPTSRRSCWINCADKNKLKLMDITGRIDDQVIHATGIGGMCATPGVNDSVLFCCYDDKCIKQLTGPEQQVSQVFSTGALHPRCVCRSMKDDEIHVTLVNSNDLKRAPDSTRCIATFKNKVETRRIEKDSFGDAIFVNPSRVKINKTGDVLAVLNRTDNENTHLVLLNKDLSLKMRYLGHNIVLDDTRFQSTRYSPERPYTINDFEFIDGDNLIVCEKYSRAVQLLAADCRSLVTVVQPGMVVPYSLAIHANRMWVGYFDGNVKVFKID